MKIVEFTPSMAQALAELWNRSDSVWPSGTTRGITKDAQDVLDRMYMVRTIAQFAALEGDKLVGFARVFPWPEDPTAAYVGTVNVDPEYHGKGFGKALMRRTVEVAMELGYWRIDLHTWPGNLKALPLYKRMGFLWVPETHVYMQNFIPTIITLAPLQAFFGAHDWQASLKPPSGLGEDGGEMEGIKVYTYRWAEGDDVLTVWIEGASGAVLGFDGPEGRFNLSLENPRLLRGQPNALHVHRDPRSARWEGLRATVEPCPGVEVAAQGAGTEGGDVLTFPFTVLPSFPEVTEGVPTPRLSVRMEAAGGAFHLGLGLKVEKALAVTPEAHDLACYGHSPRVVTLKLTNNIGRAVEAKVKIRGRAGIRASLLKGLTLPADGEEVLTVEVKPNGAPGTVGVLRVDVEAPGVPREPDLLPFPILGPGSKAVYRLPTAVWVLENPQARWEVAERGGTVSLFLGADRRCVLKRWGEHVGPPYIPSALLNVPWEVHRGRGSDLVLRTPIPDHPGARIVKTLSLEESLLTVRYTLDDPEGRLKGKRLLFSGRKEYDFGVLTLPALGKIMEGEVAEFDYPDYLDDIPREGFVDEGWAHVQEEGFGLGMAWSAPGSWRITSHFWTFVELEFNLGGGGGPSLLLIAPARDWREVRQVWSLLEHGDPRPPPRTVEIIPSVRITPRVPLLNPEGRVRVEVSNRRRKILEGTLHLEAPLGVATRGDDGVVRDLDLTRTYSHEWLLSGPSMEGLQVRRGRVVLRSSLTSWEEELPFILMPPPGPCSISNEGPMWTLSPGPFTLQVAPAFAGGAVSLRHRGRELLHSAYPMAREFSFFKPWHGGILPQIEEDGFPADLEGEAFEAKPLEEGPWKGLRLHTHPKRPSLRGMVLTTEYLIRPGTPLLGLRTSVENPTPQRVKGRVGQAFFLRPGGVLNARIHLLQETWRHREAAESRGFFRVRGHAVVFEPLDGTEPMTVAGATPGADMWMGDYGSLGRHLYTLAPYSLPAGGSATLGAFVAIAPEMETAKALSVLTRLNIHEDLSGAPDMVPRRAGP